MAGNHLALSEKKQLHTVLRVVVIASAHLVCNHPSFPWSALLPGIGWMLWTPDSNHEEKLARKREGKEHI